MEITIKPSVKDPLYRTRIENTYKYFFKRACEFYSVSEDELKIPQFEEFIGMTKGYWAHIIHGRRPFKSDKSNAIEKKFGLIEGELDKPVSEIVEIPDLMWQCVIALDDLMKDHNFTLPKEKREKICREVYESSTLLGQVDNELLLDRFLLAKP